MSGTSLDFYCDEILTSRVSVQKLIETANVLSFHHTQPFWPVHIVIIPKKHIESLVDLSRTDLPILSEMLGVAADICRQIVAKHGGCRLSTNCGDYQSTPHLHFYVHQGKRLRDGNGIALPPHLP